MNPRRIGAALLGALIAALYLTWTWNPDLADLGGDNASYLLMARHFSPWEPPSPIARFFTAQNNYPPLYPLLLGLLGGAGHALIAHLLTTAALLGGLAVYYRWLEVEGASPLLALALPLVFAILPGTYLQASSLSSENLYLLLSLGALFALARREPVAATGAPDRKGLALGFTATALALLSRSAAIALLLSVVLHTARLRPLRNAGLVALAWLPALLWQWIGGQKRDGYVSDWLQRAGQFVDVEGWERALALTEALASTWQGYLFGPIPGFAIAAVVLGVVAVIGCLWRACLGRIDGIYGSLYAGMVVVWAWVWPSELSRLLFPLVPILLFQAHWAVDKLLGRRLQVRTRPYLHGALLAVWAIGSVPYATHTITRFHAPVPPELEPFRRVGPWYAVDYRHAAEGLENYAAITQAFRDLSRHVPVGECVYAPKPSLVGYYAERISRDPPREALDNDAFARQIAADGCRYVLGLNWSTPTFPTPLYPLGRLGDRGEVVETWFTRGGTGDLVAVLAVIAAERAR